MEITETIAHNQVVYNDWSRHQGRVKRREAEIERKSDSNRSVIMVLYKGIS